MATAKGSRAVVSFSHKYPRRRQENFYASGGDIFTKKKREQTRETGEETRSFFYGV
jgi:predicted nucleotidyltransferase